MVRLNLDQVKSTINQAIPKVPKAIGMITFASSGIWMARQCSLIALHCTKSGRELSLHILSQKGLESVNPAGILTSSLITKCSPSFYEFAALSLGAAATCCLAYRFAKEIIYPRTPLPPIPPSAKAKKAE